MQALGPDLARSRREVQTAKPSGFWGRARGASAARIVPNRGQAIPDGLDAGAVAVTTLDELRRAVRKPPPKPTASSAIAASTTRRPIGLGIPTPDTFASVLPGLHHVNRVAIAGRRHRRGRRGVQRSSPIILARNSWRFRER